MEDFLWVLIFAILALVSLRAIKGAIKFFVFCFCIFLAVFVLAQ